MKRLRLTVVLAALLVSASTSAQEPEGSVEEMVQGLWSYTTIQSQGQEQTPIVGLFLFHDGHFVQQAIGGAGPLKDQVGQAHAGAYRVDGDALKLLAGLGLVVFPNAEEPLAENREGQHDLVVERAGDELTITFGTSTIQKFKRVNDGGAQIFNLDRGYLALTDNHFILVATPEGEVIAGSGSFVRDGDSVRLIADRWFSVKGDDVSYQQDHLVEASFDGQTFAIKNGPSFKVKE